MLDRNPIAGAITASAAALMGATAATIAITPQFQETGGTDVIIEGPHLGVAGRGLLIGVSVGAAGVVAWALTSVNRMGVSLARRTAEVAAASAALGVLVGLGYRIVTARADGANIGGALVLFVSPYVTVLFIGYLVVRLRGLRRSGDPAVPDW